MSKYVMWLLTQHPRKDAIGTLARLAAMESSGFPRSKSHLNDFLTWAGEDKLLRGVVKASHREWRAVKKGWLA
jgi:hypothetical protein